jgi:hypothetical protein
MEALMKSLMLIGLSALALTGCRAKVNADELEDTGDGDGGSGLGTLTINAMSEAAAEGTDHVDMTIDRVEVHIADPDVQDDVGAEWLVLSEEEQVVPLVEQEPQSHEIASGDAPAGSYDQVKLHITSAEYETTDGDIYDLSPGDFLNGNLIIVTDFCVNGGAETVLDSQYDTTLTGDGGVSTGFDLDVAVDDGDSCSL